MMLSYCFIHIFNSFGVKLQTQGKQVYQRKVTVRELFGMLDDIVNCRRVRVQL